MLNIYSYNAVLSEWYGISQDTGYNLLPTVFITTSFWKIKMYFNLYYNSIRNPQKRAIKNIYIFQYKRCESTIMHVMHAKINNPDYISSLQTLFTIFQLNSGFLTK
jgi:hypothetical protein